tara:strand:+ start:100 stop:411 length:312 start_codon:yes stop_codon:yes gene_type:complete
MARIKPPVVITANRLTTGEVVFWGNEQQWVRKLSDALPFHDIDVASETAKTIDNELVVLGVYLVAIAASDEAHQPTHYRESIRAAAIAPYVIAGNDGAIDVPL